MTATSLSPDATPMPPAAPSRLKSWRFWLPLLIQTALVLSIPAGVLYIQNTGQPIALQVLPVDPYSVLRGYYVTFNYSISQPDNLRSLPGWDDLLPPDAEPTMQPAPNPADPPIAVVEPPNGLEFYVVLAAPAEPNAQPPLPWTAVAVSADLPTNLPDNQVALKGTYRYGWIDYGLSSYFIPEDQRVDINNQISELQFPPNVAPENRPDNPPIVVEAIVGKSGQAIARGFWLRDRQFQF